MSEENEEFETALVPVADIKPRAVLVPSREETESYVYLAKVVALSAGTAHSIVPQHANTPAKAFAIMLCGWELGVKPMTALRHIYVVNGRPEPSAQLAMGIALAREPGIQFLFPERTNERVTCIIRRPGKEQFGSTYTLDDAIAAGQYQEAWKTGKVESKDRSMPWYAYTRDMLSWAAVKRALRLNAPDLINAIEGAGGLGGFITDSQTDFEPLDASVGDVFAGPIAGLEEPRPTFTLADVKAELERQGVTTAQLATLVGGNNVKDVYAYLTDNKLDLAQAVEQAKALTPAQ